MKSSLIHCDWVIPVVGAPIADAVVVVEAGRIGWLGEKADLPQRYQTPGVPIRKLHGVMLPGLVNAHTHLQYTLFSEVGACLLYTSPSPRDLSTSRMPSSA